MTLNRSDIVTLANSLIHSNGDQTTLEESFDDTLERFAKGSAPFVETETFTLLAGTADYSIPSNAVTILGVFYGGRQLAYASAKDLEAYAADWREAGDGESYVFTFYEKDAGVVTLFPSPYTLTGLTGTFLFSELRTTDIPEWLGLPIVFEMLFEELSYPSDHQDKELAKMCANMGRFLRLFTGVL